MITINPEGLIEKIDWSIVAEHIASDTDDSDANAREVVDSTTASESESESDDGDGGGVDSDNNGNDGAVYTVAAAEEDEDEDGLGELILAGGEGGDDAFGYSKCENNEENTNKNMDLSLSLADSIPLDVIDNIISSFRSETLASVATSGDNSSGGDQGEGGVGNGDEVKRRKKVILGDIACKASTRKNNTLNCGRNNEQTNSARCSSKNNGNDATSSKEDGHKLETSSVATPRDSSSPTNNHPRAVQIVSINRDTNGDDAFDFHQFEFESIMAKIPHECQICVLSVLGAFRTGKSLLMTWFLKYLESHLGDGNTLPSREVDNADGNKWYTNLNNMSKTTGSFHWDGGPERNTLGMWMWSEPFFLTRKDSSKMALLLVDTQGMNDNETESGIQASIFGLSVMMSSFQIYNVNFQIRDDHLQQLAFFTEYGRVALGEAEMAKRDASGVPKQKPFQNIDFLVRNFQHFDMCVDEENDIAAIEKNMAEYFFRILCNRESPNLQESRDQIAKCFQKLSCYLLPYPGSAMTRKKFNGDISQIDPSFLVLLDRYCHNLFGLSRNRDGEVAVTYRLEPKSIHGKHVTAREYTEFVKAYAKTFQSFGSHFPEAQTILDATTDAHNAKIVSQSVSEYSKTMEELMSHHSRGCCLPKTLKQQHLEAKNNAMSVFKRMATFGSKEKIGIARREVVGEIERVYDLYWHQNKKRLVQDILKVAVKVIGAVALLSLTKGRRV